jgi:hypothetical protein
VYPGARARILGDAFRGWKRNPVPGLEIMRKMIRAGLVDLSRSTGRGHGPRQCIARAKSTGARCRRWALVGLTVCGKHGGHGLRVLRMSPEERVEWRKANNIKKMERARKRAERAARQQAGLLPASVGFDSVKINRYASETNEPTDMETEFKSGRKR